MNFDENLADFGCGPEVEPSMTRNGAAFLKAYARTCNLFNLVDEAGSDEDKKKEIVKNYLDFCYELGEDGKIKRGKNLASVSVSENKGFESITRARLPNIAAESKSTLYLVEFFTHCCINCIHSIEDVREVHEEIEAAYSNSLKFKDLIDEGGFKGLKVMSIHSPKFPREKDLASIKSFCTRMKMEHSEVINDPECVLWNEFGVSCWPTICIFGPNPEGTGPNLMFNFMGEGQKAKLLLSVATSMEYFGDNKKLVVDNNGNNEDVKDGNSSDVRDGQQGVMEHTSFLRFPGKIMKRKDLVVVSDSGNNRVLVLRSTGEVIGVVGCGRRGKQDGSFNEAMFYNPQGIAFETDSTLYIADTGNHAVRKVDLVAKKVSTLVESARQILFNEEMVSLKSPWDLLFYDSNTLVIAAAGNHQLFGYFFNDTTLFGTNHIKNSFTVIAGSGREENRNNSYIMKSSFAQPSGLAISNGEGTEKVIFIADSESSTIRSVSSKGQVVGLVGGSRDPMDLFAFGDMDGKGINAKLQHPMGVCAGRDQSEIFIADTYNHKIKKVDIATKECITIISSDLNEPSGICKDPADNFLYVADTNNHSIKIVDLENATIREMKVIPPSNLNALNGKFDKCFKMFINESANSTKINLVISPLPDAFEGGQWKVVSSDQDLKFSSQCGSVSEDKVNKIGQFSIEFGNVWKSESINLVLTLDVFYCGPNSCIKRTRKICITCSKCHNSTNGAEQTFEWKDLTWDS